MSVLPTDLPVAPLPTPAAVALRKLELRLTFPPAVVEAVAQYETAALRAAELAAKADAGFKLSDMQADDLVHAEDLVSGARATLAAAGRLDLIGGER